MFSMEGSSVMVWSIFSIVEAFREAKTVEGVMWLKLPDALDGRTPSLQPFRKFLGNCGDPMLG